MTTPDTHDDARLAAADESEALSGAMIEWLQGRTQALNLEVRLRDRRIAELERELAEQQRPGVPDSGDQEG